jgi:thiol-disulfide isomerase/thioredoxin
MMKNFALALLLALPAGVFVPAAGAHALHARPAPVDGVYRRAGRARRGTNRKAALRRRGRARTSEGSAAADPLTAGAMLPTVTEIDAAGLQQLLQRGDSQQGAARPLLVNFWATWCVPCRKEFPDLVKIGADYRERGLDLALVSADDVSDIKTAVPKFLREMRATAMPAYLLNAADTQAAIAQVDPAWGGELPATFLFDRQGKLAYKHFGIINDAELRASINKVMSNE